MESDFPEDSLILTTLFGFFQLYFDYFLRVLQSDNHNT
jgi:hypothetical protein